MHAEEPALMELLERAEVSSHPMVIAELALGTMRDRDMVLGLLNNLPGVILATHDEVSQLIESRVLMARI